ncbi:MAG: xanthine dehydrogenase family protein subunit M [Anaerolineales bacterium]
MTTQEYLLPKSVDEAVQLLDQYGPALQVMAGGTILMPLVNEGISLPERVMGLRQAGLNYIQESNGHVSIGAATTLSQMLAWEKIPLLQQSARNVGGWAIRNMGTVGGNLFAPPPSGDFAVALLALDAKVRFTSTKNQRLMPLEEFYTGFMTTALEPGEIVAEIRVPVPEGKTAYVKLGRKHANTPAVVTVAVRIVFNGETVEEARIALNAVGPHPLRSVEAEKSLIGSKLDDQAIATAADLAAEHCEPFSDAIASEWYRRKMVSVFVRRALAQISP